LLPRDFIELGSKLGISTQVAITYGEEPISHTIGPALEAREALEILMRKGRVTDAVEKAVEVAGILLEIVGERGGKELALSALRGGRAEEKLREIIEAQGGDPGIRPDDIGVGRYELDVRAERSGYVLWMNNFSLVQAARLAGAPKDKEAGIYLHRKIGDRVEKGESILTVYSNREYRLDKIDELLEETKAIGVGKRYEMLIAKVKEVEERKRAFLLER
ncbi:TPA: thymidine phosphorylase, partial [Candidatus Bathyarchaeota archaeon]|nr:thymidine phosphorylase [Candidatus Bathyarchaeota archaeon]